MQAKLADIREWMDNLKSCVLTQIRAADRPVPPAGLSPASQLRFIGTVSGSALQEGPFNFTLVQVVSLNTMKLSPWIAPEQAEDWGANN